MKVVCAWRGKLKEEVSVYAQHDAGITLTYVSKINLANNSPIPAISVL